MAKVGRTISVRAQCDQTAGGHHQATDPRIRRERIMTRRRDIASEILEGLSDASAYLAGRKTGVRVTKVHVPAAVEGRAIHQRLKTNQAEFATRYPVPPASPPKSEPD